MTPKMRVLRTAKLYSRFPWGCFQAQHLLSLRYHLDGARSHCGNWLTPALPVAPPRVPIVTAAHLRGGGGIERVPAHLLASRKTAAKQGTSRIIPQNRSTPPPAPDPASPPRSRLAAKKFPTDNRQEEGVFPPASAELGRPHR